jgi:hypothetical protein
MLFLIFSNFALFPMILLETFFGHFSEHHTSANLDQHKILRFFWGGGGGVDTPT